MLLTCRDRFTQGFAAYGYVRRPILDVHPEHQVWTKPLLIGGRPSWLTRKTEDGDPKDEDDAVGAPRRDSELADWAQTIRSNRPWEPLHPEVRGFFCGLAFRFGYTCTILAARERPRWGMMRASPDAALEKLRRGFEEWDAAYIKMTEAEGKHFLLADVVKRADPGSYREGMSEDDAAQLVRHKLLAEAELSLTPLHPVRQHRYVGDDGGERVVTRRPGVWDWARPEVRGRARQFFSLDRWPLHLQTEKTARRTERGDDLDPRTLWDPCSEDITPFTWYREKPRLYTEEKVVYKPGPSVYPIGDTKRQQRAVESMITNRFADGKLHPIPCSPPPDKANVQTSSRPAG